MTTKTTPKMISIPDGCTLHVGNRDFKGEVPESLKDHIPEKWMKHKPKPKLNSDG